MNRITSKDEMFFKLCERRLLPILPIRENLKDLPLSHKAKFWHQLMYPILATLILILLFGLVGNLIGFGICYYWFNRWNRYLRTVEFETKSMKDKTGTS